MKVVSMVLTYGVLISGFMMSRSPTKMSVLRSRILQIIFSLKISTATGLVVAVWDH